MKSFTEFLEEGLSKKLKSDRFDAYSALHKRAGRTNTVTVRR